MAIKIKLRQKAISGNRHALYLDFYPAIINPETGKETRREFLNMYLFNEIEYSKQKYIDKKGKENEGYLPVLNEKGKQKKIKLNPINKIENENTLKLAEQIKAKREKQLNGNEALTELEKRMLEKDKKETERGEKNFVEYFKSK